MAPSLIFSFVAFLTALSAARPLADSAENGKVATVDLGYATYEGTVLRAGVDQFLGMRFAAPPVGDLRFAAPKNPVRKSGVQKATAFRPICVGTGQNVSDTLSEDCLFINVFAPTNSTTRSKLPVWFYIQGGGYVADSQANYNGTDVIEMSDYNVVVVNFNYRVGALGFLASEEVRKHGALNVGLLDQRKALEWVQKYITLFGGDPDHVVIHGASAGGGSVAHHMTAYGGRDDRLFVGAIPESPYFPTQRTVAQSQSQFSQFVQDAGCSAASNALACLRSLDINAIQKANVAMPYPGAKGLPLGNYAPVIDGSFVQDSVYSQFANGKFVKVPTLVGDDTNEGSYFAPNASTPAEATAYINDNYPRLNAQQLAQVQKAYPKEAPVPEHAPYFPSASAAYGDAAFTCGGIFVSRAVAKYLSPMKSWNYRYNVQDPQYIAEGFGVPHTSETPAIFGVGYAGGKGSSLQTTNKAIVPVVMDYYLSFVQTLNPNHLRLPSSPAFKPFGSTGSRNPENRLKIQTNCTEMEVVPKLQDQKCALWKSLYPTMQQ